MINLQRAERKTEFWKATTPGKVGPGIYDQNNKSQFDHQKDATAPFNTTKDRTVGEALNSNPGPGNYASEVKKIVPKVQDKMHNAFTTKIARFCPTAPGSGMVTGPTYQQSPDPGNYYVAPKWDELKDQDKTLLKYKQKQHKDLAVIPQPIANSIPARKLAATAYTAKGFDFVGPAAYNPKQPAIRKQHP